MTESQLKAKVVKYIREHYLQYWIYCPTDLKIAGIPDIILCTDGHFVALELKIKGRNPGSRFKLQLHILEQIRKAGGTASVCYSVEDVKKMLDKKD